MTIEFEKSTEEKCNLILIHMEYLEYLNQENSTIFIEYKSKNLKIPAEKLPKSFTEWIELRFKMATESLNLNSDLYNSILCPECQETVCDNGCINEKFRKNNVW